MLRTVLIFFLFKAALVSASHSVSQYDQTKILNETIVRIFRENNYASKDLDIVSKAEPEIGTYKYKAENTKKLKPFGSKILLDILLVTLSGYPYPVYTTFLKNETSTRIYFRNILCKFHGTAYVTPNNTAVEFQTSLTCVNYTIIHTRYPTSETGEMKSHIHASCDAFTTNRCGTYLEECINIPYKTQLNLIHAIGIISPSILNVLFVANKHYAHFLRQYFSPPLINLPACATDSPKNEQLYYYAVPDISLICLHLNNIKIAGLSNFRTYRWNMGLSLKAHTLTLSNIRGSMDASQELMQIPLHRISFSIEHLDISVDQIDNKMWIETRGYSDFQINSTSAVSISSCLSKYSAIIMRHVESALGHSIMPSMTVEVVGEPISLSALHEMEKCIHQLLKNATIDS